MRYLTIKEALQLHQHIIEQTGGKFGIRDFGSLESALAQPLMTFAGDDLYPSLSEKAAALAFSVIKNHPFFDGNKRIGHALMEAFLLLNGHELGADVDEQEKIILELASGLGTRDAFVGWVRDHITQGKTNYEEAQEES
jgi:death-on-curing protein